MYKFILLIIFSLNFLITDLILCQVVIKQDTVRCSCATPTLSTAGTYTMWNKHNYVVCINLFEWALGTGDEGFSIGNATHYIQLNPNMTYTDVLRFNDYPHLAHQPYGWKKNKMYVRYYQQNCSTFVGFVEINLKGYYASDLNSCPPTSITNKDGNIIPNNYYIEQNYPNPFNPVTKIKFGLPKNSFASLKVYNILGKEVETLVYEKLSAGNYIIDWDATDFSSGLYFIKFESELYSNIIKALLIK
jgi:hypothetical protein